MSGKPFVAVLGADGKPLMPCTGKRARKLLDTGRARVVRCQPFVIQLKDRSQDDCEFQDMTVKLDPGSKTTGVAVARISSPEILHVIRLIELQHRGETIKLNLLRRRMYRRHRRQRRTRYRQARFLNRRKPKGWLPPSLMHRVQTTMTWIRRLMRWFPISELATEVVRFDSQKLQNPEITNVEYQQGTLSGYEVREYLLEKWQHKCAYCDTSKVTRFEIDHVRPRSKGGSDRVSNLALACAPCNKRKSTLPLETFLAHDPARIVRIQKQLKRPLKDAAAVNSTRNRLLSELVQTGLPVETGTGAQTKYNRCRLNLPKTHALDALCVGRTSLVEKWHRPVMVVGCCGRGRYSRTTTDRHGFPKHYLLRKKKAYGFQTGDFVYAVQPRKGISLFGTVTVRQNGMFIVKATKRLIEVTWKNCKKLQSSDGYSYFNV